MTFSTLL